jgi:hypothetical protein
LIEREIPRIGHGYSLKSLMCPKSTIPPKETLPCCQFNIICQVDARSTQLRNLTQGGYPGSWPTLSGLLILKNSLGVHASMPNLNAELNLNCKEFKKNPPLNVNHNILPVEQTLRDCVKFNRNDEKRTILITKDHINK